MPGAKDVRAREQGEHIAQMRHVPPWRAQENRKVAGKSRRQQKKVKSRTYRNDINIALRKKFRYDAGHNVKFFAP